MGAWGGVGGRVGAAAHSAESAGTSQSIRFERTCEKSANWSGRVPQTLLQPQHLLMTPVA